MTIDDAFRDEWEELRKQQQKMFPDITATKMAVYKSWFDAGVEACQALNDAQTISKEDEERIVEMMTSIMRKYVSGISVWYDENAKFSMKDAELNRMANDTLTALLKKYRLVEIKETQ